MATHPDTPALVGEELLLEGGSHTFVVRRGDVVHRTTGAWALTVQAFLKHLENVGFAGAPRVVGSGFDVQGCETLSFVAGEFVHPAPWSDAGLHSVGALLRGLHDAAASFVPPPNAHWQPWFLREVGEGARVVVHGDAAPWNTVTRNGCAIAFIDWEYAGPLDPRTELARVCWLFAQLHDDDVAARVGLPDLPTRARQLRLLVESYGLSAAERRGLFDLMVEVAVREAANEAVEMGVTPDSTGPMWGLAWRTRAAAWMLRHRRALEAALS